MQRKMKKNMKKVIAALVLTAVVAVGVPTNTYALESNASYTVQEESVSIINSTGWLESASVEWEGVKGATGYRVYYKSANASDSKYQKLDNELIREYPTYFRVDVLGLAEGNYKIKIVPIIDNKEDTLKQAITTDLEVKNHTREGFAFSKESLMKTGSGGYNDDGTLQENSQIVYITADTVNTVKLDVITSSSGKKTEATGLVDILTKRAKGYDKRPLIIRMIGQIKGEDIVGLNSNGYIQLKGIYNTTLEGVGEDATAYGFGFLIRNSYNVELRNVGIMLFPDDAISLDTGNENIWVHNNDIFYGKPGSDADQVKGDGSADVKGKSTYVTISYNHFYDSGKASLCGMSDTEEFFVTYHHNWFDHSDSRHPRIRVGTVHIYNNYFDGNSKYGVGVTKGSSAFVEANVFRNCKYPMLTSLQGTDIYNNSKGSFSGEAGGMIKAYNNQIVGAARLVYANENATQFDAYLATSRDEKVSSDYKSVSGKNTYNNFDTSSSMYEYTPDSTDNVKEVVTTYAGRVNGGDFTWEFTNEDDSSSSINTLLKAAIVNYETKLVSVGGNSGEVIEPTEPTEPTQPTEPTNPDEEISVIDHNFTLDNNTSKFFTIKGKLSSTKGVVSYKDLTLSQCLKVETSTKITFETDAKANLTLVFNSSFKKSILIDGKEYKAVNGIVNVDLEAGSHVISKSDSCNLYYMELTLNK